MRMPLSAVIAAIGLAALAACNAAPEPAQIFDATAVAAEVQQGVDKSVAAFGAGDAEGAIGNIADDFIGMFHGEPNVIGRAAELETTKAQVLDPSLKLTVSNEVVDVAEAGDMAVYTSTYIYNFTDPESGKPATETGNWILIFKRQSDGLMKATYGIVSDMPPA